MQELVYEANLFGGAVCDPAALPDDAEEFSQALAHSLVRWRDEELKVIWLEIPITRSHLIPIAVEAGLVFHHSGPDYLMMIDRLEPDAFAPPFATHYVGAGGVVLRENEILVVSERHRRSKTPYYKLPGGALHPGEDLAEGVMREVLEETGIRTKFEALACFRHWHGYRYGKSDIYFICKLSPLNHKVSMQEEEIDDCFWMSVDEYMTSDRVHTFNRLIVKAALGTAGLVATHLEGYSDGSREVFMPHKLVQDEAALNPIH